MISKNINNMHEYQELMKILQKAMDTLRTASTQGAHYLLISFLKTKYNIATNSREEAMKTARDLINNYDFETTGSTPEMDKYAEQADQE